MRAPDTLASCTAPQPGSEEFSVQERRFSHAARGGVRAGSTAKEKGRNYRSLLKRIRRRGPGTPRMARRRRRKGWERGQPVPAGLAAVPAPLRAALPAPPPQPQHRRAAAAPYRASAALRARAGLQHSAAGPGPAGSAHRGLLPSYRAAGETHLCVCAGPFPGMSQPLLRITWNQKAAPNILLAKRMKEGGKRRRLWCSEMHFVWRQ